METETSNTYQLIRELLKLSSAKSWQKAKQEWEIVGISILEEHERCLCGYGPISEVCTLKNTVNGNTARVGIVCARKIINQSSNLIIESININVKLIRVYQNNLKKSA